MNIQKDFNTAFGSPDIYRRLVENLHAGIYVADVKGCLVYVNHSFAYMLGYSSKDEIIGLNMAEQLYVHSEDRLKFLNEIEKVGFVRDYEVQNKRKDGTFVTLSVTSSVILDENNQRAGIEGVIYDITERKKMQNRLYIFEKSVEQTADHVMITDKEGVIQYVNPAFEATTGYSSNEVIGKTPKILQSGRQGPEYYKKLWATILSGETFYAQTTNKKKNGDHYVADQTISPIFNESKQITHFVSIWKDITERVRLEESVLYEKQKLEEIVGFDEKICAIRKSDRLLDFVVSKTMKILDARKCSIMFIEKESGELCTKANVGFEEKEASRIHIKDSIAAPVIEEGKALLIGNVFPQIRPTSENENKASPFMVAPIKRDGETIGVINVADKNSHSEEGASFNELDLKILCDIAREVAVALENVRFYKELQFLTVKDPVTDVHNFRHFSNTLDYEIKRIEKFPGDLALLMMDVDNFKSFNDQFGQDAGNKLLREIGRIIKTILEDADILCRYAGDQFVAILPGSSKQDTILLADRIREAVERATFDTPMTVSIGVAQYKPAMSRRDLTVKADRALCQAKKDGKNRTCV
ncbi:MAG: PAS domain S-box protein [Candidatus Omnitrophica bacterium]|nr:PAS domain S-box protein [Candidatus Omnitrophota bacterium]